MHKYTIRKLLNIPEYKVTEILSNTEKEIHIRLEPYKHKKAICSYCKTEFKQGYYGSYWSIVEDRSLCDKRAYLHVRKRKYRCNCDGRVHTENIAWLRKHSRVTRRLAEQVNRLTAITTNQEAGWFMGMNDEVICRIDKEILEEKFKEPLDPPPAAINMSVDEVSYKKYHRYLTNSLIQIND